MRAYVSVSESVWDEEGTTCRLSHTFTGRTNLSSCVRTEAAAWKQIHCGLGSDKQCICICSVKTCSWWTSFDFIFNTVLLWIFLALHLNLQLACWTQSQPNCSRKFSHWLLPPILDMMNLSSVNEFKAAVIKPWIKKTSLSIKMTS